MTKLDQEDRERINEIIREGGAVSATAGNPASSYQTSVSVVYRIEDTAEVLYKEPTRDGPRCLSRGKLVEHGEAGVSVLDPEKTISAIETISEEEAEEIMKGATMPAFY